MIDVVEFKKEHLKLLLDEPQNQNFKKWFKEADFEIIEKSRLAYTILSASDKKVLFCGGVTEYWSGRGECWAFFHANVKEYFVQIHKAVLKYFSVCPVKRIEATVVVDFKAGHRWIKSLGFKLEAPVLKSYQPDGKDVSLYARVS